MRNLQKGKTMAKEESGGIPDAISIDFSRQVRDALKEREEKRQPPWTITALARTIGIENNQITNINRYVNIGVSDNGYIHWRPDWMLKIARVLEIAVDFNVKESKSPSKTGSGGLTETPAAEQSVKLRVGLASDYPDLFEMAFEIYAACANARAREHGGSFQIDIDKPGSRDKVYAKFLANCSDYDVIMIDDPWIPEFEPKLLDLRNLPLEEFKDTKHLEELFFEPLLEICKFPIDSGKLCGLPIMGDVDFLFYDTTAAWNERVRDLLNGSVIDPDQLKHEVLSEHRNRATLNGGPGACSAISFAIRNLDDEDLVEHFWLLMRGYGLEDSYRSQHKGNSEIRIPANLAKRASDWMYEINPEWNRRISGGEILDNMISGSGSAMTFAWPNTVLPKVRNDPSIATRIGLHQFARQGLLGAQVLAIPEGSGRERERIEAAKAILTLTTNSRFQFMLADLGSIPVLNDLPHRIELRNRPFWKENYAKMEEALRTSHPRPRTPRWREFSKRLAEQIRRRRFSDVPGLMRFT
jgi:ABC-type glycerol-3-phosphate transport system substrate-binding protein